MVERSELEKVGLMAKLLDSAAAYITERSWQKTHVWERNWLADYHSLLGDAPTLEAKKGRGL